MTIRACMTQTERLGRVSTLSTKVSYQDSQRKLECKVEAQKKQ